VAKAWKILHEQHKDTIINTFRNLGLSLNPDGSEDSELKIRDLSGIEVGDYTLVQEDTMVTDVEAPPSADLDFQNPIAPFTMELRSQTHTTSTCRDLYYTAKEIRDRVSEIEDKDVTTDSGDETGDSVDSEDDFDPESDEEDMRDMNMKD
jgi:hypothetical protein